jgi:hypothetical protein
VEMFLHTGIIPSGKCEIIFGDVGSPCQLVWHICNSLLSKESIVVKCPLIYHRQPILDPIVY